MSIRKIESLTRQALQDYSMIQAGDRIAVGISGGKDSLTLLASLAALRRYYPESFELIGITVDLGFGNQDFDKIKIFCESLSVPYYCIHTQIAEIIFDSRKEENPCSLCAKMRKGAMLDRLVELKVNKLAFAHHMDDFIETMYLSLLYEGRFHTFSPVTFYEDRGISIIRPLLYVEEREVIKTAHEMQYPIAKSNCPVDGSTKREYVKNLLKQMYHENPGLKKRLFHAITKDEIWKD